MAAIASCPGILHAQTARSEPAAESIAAPPPSTLKINARLVVLDVVVSDAAGKFASGLKASDFQVYEDGRPQRIQSFEPPSAHNLPAAMLADGSTEIFDPARPANFGQSPVNILVLDQLNTHFADTSFARRSLHDYLATQPAILPQPTSLLTVYDNGFKQLQGFTRNRDALQHALATTPAKYDWKLEINGKTDHGPIDRLDQSLRALEEIAESDARIAGRKNLIWAGGGFPTLDPGLLDSKDMREVKEALQHVTNILLDTRVTLYAVDPASSAAGMTEVTDASQMDFIQAGGEFSAGSADPFGAGEDFDKLGPVTGGRVIRGLNDVARQIASSVDLGSNFYTISYAPRSDSEAAAQYRKVRVVCMRAGLTATTRTGYYSGHTEQEKSSASAAYDLSTAAQGAMPLNGLRVNVEPDSSAGSLPNSYIVRVSVGELNWKPNLDGSATASVYVMAVSLDPKSKMLAHVVQGMKAEARSGTDLRDDAQSANFHFSAPPAAKAVTLRFIVRDSATGRMGSFDLPLTKR